MTKAEAIYKSDKDPREKYNELLTMWQKGVRYTDLNRITGEQEVSFYDIPKYLGLLLEKIQPVPSLRTEKEVMEGFK